MSPWRAKVAALLVLFFLGAFAGQLNQLIEGIRGRVDGARRATEQVRDTVDGARLAADSAADVVGDLTNQVADLQAKLAAGTATPAQVESLRGLMDRLRGATGGSGVPGPPGPPGAVGPPGPAATSPGSGTTTSTIAGGTTTTTRRSGTTTTTRRPTTTTTRCIAGVGRLLKVGC